MPDIDDKLEDTKKGRLSGSNPIPSKDDLAERKDRPGFVGGGEWPDGAESEKRPV